MKTSGILALIGFASCVVLSGCGGAGATRATAIGAQPTSQMEGALSEASVTETGPGLVAEAGETRAEGNFPKGQCTWYVNRRAAEAGWRLDFRSAGGNDAGNWWDTVTNATRGQTPRAGSILVIKKGSGSLAWGHVLYVESVNGSKFTCTHANWSHKNKARVLDGVQIYSVECTMTGGNVRFEGYSSSYAAHGFLYRR